MKYRIYFIAPLIVFLFGQCTKELPFPDADDNPQLVINSLFTPDEDLEVHVSQSCHIKDAQCVNVFLDGAEVLLLDNAGSVLATLDHKGQGIYTSAGFKVSHDTQYQIEVRSNNQDLTNATSTSTIPQQVKSSIISTQEAIVDGHTSWSFDIEIEDNPSEENYYLLEGYFKKDGVNHGDQMEEEQGYILPHFKHYTDDPNAENKTIGAGVLDIATPALRYVFLTDKNFNGKTYQTRIGVVDQDSYEYGAGKSSGIVSVKSVSKEMYEYIRSLTTYSLRKGNPFSEPEQIFTNVDKGLGIFAGYSQKVFPIDLPISKYTIPQDISVDNDGCTAPCVVSFSTDGGSALSYFWTFGDGQNSTEANPEHSYTAPGVYEVECLIQIDNNSYSWGFLVTIN